MKKSVALLLALLMLVTTVPFVSSAESMSAALLTVDTTYGMPGSVVNVNVSIAGNPGISSMGMTMTFDSGLSLVGAKNGTAFSELNLTSPSQLSKGGSVTESCRFAWLGNDDAEADGVILQLQFAVDENAPLNRDYGIRISCENGDVLNDERQLIDIVSIDGYITVIDYVPGDVNNSGDISMLDVLTLCQYYVDDCRYDPDGYAVEIKEEAGDVNADGRITMLDVLLISQYYVDGCQYDPDGYAVKLLPGKLGCIHSMQHTSAKAASCTEDGNIEYWYCSNCDQYFGNADGTDEISIDSIIIKASHKPVHYAYKEPNYTEAGNKEYWKCSVCAKYYENQNCTVETSWDKLVIEKLQKEEATLLYDIYGTDTYLKNLGVFNPNPDKFIASEGLVLQDLTGPAGYTFKGWKNSSGEYVTTIAPGTQSGMTVYAQWEEQVYEIKYNVLKTPVESLIKITDEYDPYHFTVSKGKPDLPNPVMKNYVFLGWFDNDGNEVLSIPAGTAKDITLTPYYTSMRYLAKTNTQPGPEFFINDYENNAFYYVKELGTIENIPLANLWESPIMSRAGLDSTVTNTVSVSVTKTQAESIAKELTKATTDSNTWTLSKDWNNTTQVNKEVAEERKLTQEQATTQAMSASGTISLTDSMGGKSSTTKTNGTTTLTYDTKEHTKGNSQELDVGIGGEIGINKGTPLSNGGAGAKVNAHIDGKFEWHDETTTKSGTETTKVNTTVKQNESSWNSELSQSFTQQASISSTLSQAMSQAVSEKFGYGQSYSEGGSESSSQQFTNSASESVNASTTLTYSDSTVTTTTQTFHADGNIEGKYMLVQAGTAHVFAVVGYDIATKSFFTYTFNVMDDVQYQYLDYSPLSANFDDCQYSVLPFEVPGMVYDYAATLTACTEGLGFRTDSENGTATVTNYDGTSAEVAIPSYIVANNTAYRVTGISASAFAGKDITTVIFSDFIDEIPAGAFKDCAKLKGISGNFTKIGNDAFSGCVALDDFHITENIQFIGERAFQNALKLTAITGDPAIASAVVNSGAQNIVLDISPIEAKENISIIVPEIQSFELLAGNQTYSDIKIVSKASTTKIKQIKIKNNNGIPLDIYSDNLILDTVSVTCGSYALMLHQDGVNISLFNDSSLTSNSGCAMVCKNPKFISESAEFVNGYITVIGDIYYCGSITGEENIYLSGKTHELSEEEFEKYIKGVFTITFDPNGGKVSEASRQYLFGQALGDLPTPTRDYYTFDYWYTSDGARVTTSTILDTSNGITVYAHWTEKPLSDWVPASSVPAGADVREERWTYTKTETTESTSSSMSGWSQTGSYWSKTGSGSVNYATFPSTFDTGNWYYQNYAKSALSAYDNGSTKREVSNGWSGYIYWHWMYDVAYANTTTRTISDRSGSFDANGNSGGYYYKVFRAIASSVDCPTLGTGYCCSRGQTSYNCNSIISDTSGWGTPRCFRFNYYTSYYTDYQRVYQYKKVTKNLISQTQIYNGGQISDVQHQVRYRAK